MELSLVEIAIKSLTNPKSCYCIVADKHALISYRTQFCEGFGNKLMRVSTENQIELINGSKILFRIPNALYVSIRGYLLDGYYVESRISRESYETLLANCCMRKKRQYEAPPPPPPPPPARIVGKRDDRYNT